MSHTQHQQAAENIVATVAVITLSDTRTPADDTSGQRIQQLLLEAGHQIARYKIIPDDAALLHEHMAEALSDPAVNAIITNGGTGISRRDATINAIETHLRPILPGFGELFRMLSWQQVGAAAMLSRATAGIAQGRVVFALPGSTKAVELAMTQLILPELKHLLRELTK